MEWLNSNICLHLTQPLKVMDPLTNKSVFELIKDSLLLVSEHRTASFPANAMNHCMMWLLSYLISECEWQQMWRRRASQHLPRSRWMGGLYGFRSGALQQGYRAGRRQPLSRCLLALGRLWHCLPPLETNTNCPLAPGWRCAAGDMWLKIALLVPMSGGHKAP